jgi:hypothetical protein
MQNEPNFPKSQMVATLAVTTNYNEKPTLDTWSKRTQTKPILPAMAGKIALSAVEGPVQSRTILSRAQSPALSLPNGRDLSKQLLPHPLNPRIMLLRFHSEPARPELAEWVEPNR